jgi:hypothetical protein
MQNEALHSEQYDALLWFNLDVFSGVLYIYVWVKYIFTFVHSCILQMQIRGLAMDEDVYWYKNNRYYTVFENSIFVYIVHEAVKYKRIINCLRISKYMKFFLFKSLYLLAICQSNLNPYCMGRKAAFIFSGHWNVRT